MMYPLHGVTSQTCLLAKFAGAAKDREVGGGLSLCVGGANMYIFVFTYFENNGFKKKVIRQSLNV